MKNFLKMGARSRRKKVNLRNEVLAIAERSREEKVTVFAQPLPQI